MPSPLHLLRRIRTKSRREIAIYMRCRIQDAAALFCGIPRLISAPTYRSFLPDSLFVFDLHPEFRQLATRFFAHNHTNRGDVARLTAFILNIKQVLAEGVAGDFAELGVWRGNTAAVLAHYAALAGRQTLLFDTFEGFDQKDINGIDGQKKVAFQNTSMELTASIIAERTGVKFVKGYFPDTVADDFRAQRFAVVSLDCDLYAPMKNGLEFFYPRMEQGAILLLHDYSGGSWEGAKRAIDEFCAATGEHLILIPDKSGSAFIRKSQRLESHVMDLAK